MIAATSASLATLTLGVARDADGRRYAGGLTTKNAEITEKEPGWTGGQRVGRGNIQRGSRRWADVAALQASGVPRITTEVLAEVLEETGKVEDLRRPEAGSRSALMDWVHAVETGGRGFSFEWG